MPDSSGHTKEQETLSQLEGELVRFSAQGNGLRQTQWKAMKDSSWSKQIYMDYKDASLSHLECLFFCVTNLQLCLCCQDVQILRNNAKMLLMHVTTGCVSLQHVKCLVLEMWILVLHVYTTGLHAVFSSNFSSQYNFANNQYWANIANIQYPIVETVLNAWAELCHMPSRSHMVFTVHALNSWNLHTHDL